MTNTIDKLNRANPFSLDFLKILLRGTGQVMFQNNVWTGLLFFIGIFWGAYAEKAGVVAWGALLGVGVSTLTGYLLGLPEREGRQGLWGFNGVLVGCAFPTFMGNTVWMWLALVLCAALTTWVRTGFNRVMAPWKVNSLTFPFVFCTWIFLLAARAMHGLPTAHMTAPALPDAFATAVDLGFGHLVVYWLKGIAQVFLIDSWVTGLLFLAGLFLADRRAALWAAVGSALALLTTVALHASGSEIAGGLYGYSPVLTAIALATVVYRPGRSSALWAILGILVTVFVQAGMYVLLAPVGIATLTAPFCIATWLFLLPLFEFDEAQKPDHSNWDPENKRHLAGGAASAAGPGAPASDKAATRPQERRTTADERPAADRRTPPDGRPADNRTPRPSQRSQTASGGDPATQRGPRPRTGADNARTGVDNARTGADDARKGRDGQSKRTARA